MHPCLEIAEVVDDIAEYLAALPSWKNPRASLLNMALACRTLYEPAMNALWHEVDDFSWLLQLLPADAILKDIDDGFYRTGHWSIVRPLTPQDCTRFNHHAVRVRILKNDERMNPAFRVDPACYDRLKALYGDQPALPHVQVLTCNLKPNNASLFLSSATREFDVWETAIRPYPLRELLGVVARCAPGIEDLQLTQSSLTTRCDAEQMAMLASFPNLKKLAFGFQHDMTSFDPAFLTRSPLAFHRLQKLVLFLLDNGDNPNDIRPVQHLTTFLDALANLSPPLTSFYLQTSACHQPSTLQALTTTIARFGPRLDTCSLAFWHRTSDAPHGPFALSTFAPLRAIPSLRGLDLNGLAVDLARGDVLHLLEAWPRLETLNLGCNASTHIHADDLPLLVARCPRLERLVIRICDARGNLRAAAQTVVPHPPLTYLQLTGSRLTDVDGLAAFLDALFPEAEVKLYGLDDQARAMWFKQLDVVKKSREERWV